jgi:hypothetical protein
MTDKVGYPERLSDAMELSTNRQFIYLTKILHMSILLLIVMVTILVCVASTDVLKTVFGSAIVLNLNGFFSSVDLNHQYFDSVNGGLGFRYSLAIALNTYIVAFGYMGVIVIVALSIFFETPMLPRDMIKLFPTTLLATLGMTYIIFFQKYIPSQNAYKSAWQQLFSTEWVIFFNSVLAFFIYASTYIFIVTTMKVVRSRGRLRE